MAIKVDRTSLPILIFSKDPVLINYLESLLGALGQEGLASNKIQETLERIREYNPEVVLLDSRLSDSDWGKLIKSVHELENAPSFLLLTDSSDQEWNKDLGENSRLHRIQRPINPEILRKKIEMILVGKNNGSLESSSDTAYLGVTGYPFEVTSGAIVGLSKEIKQIWEVVEKVASTDVTVLIRGESGTGKELIARRIHQQSDRKDKPFIKVLCPAIPDTLLESELFGYEKGSFTGAYTKKPGRFEFADKGTIFLDEIGDIPLSLQSKLLQVLQEGEFVRIGGKSDIRVDVRITAATNKDLDRAVREGSFREDLYYRLNVVNIHVPPLRDRREDIPVLVHNFLEQYNQKFNKRVILSEDTLNLFMEYQWPGNVRELKHILEGVVILGNEKEVVAQLRPKLDSAKAYLLGRSQPAGNTTVSPEHTGASSNQFQKASAYPLVERRKQDRRQNSVSPSRSPRSDQSDPISLKSVSRDAANKAEDDLIMSVLEQTRWNRKQAAKIMGISYKALLYKIKRIQKK